MRGRKKDSTNPNTEPTATPAHPTDELATEPQGPGDDRFVYHLTPKALALLAEHQGDGAEESGDPLARPVADTPAIRDAVQADTRQQRRRRRRREARRRGRRFATVHRVTRGARQLPMLRLSGQWLREAGFDLGQEYEVEVGEGRFDAGGAVTMMKRTARASREKSEDALAQLPDVEPEKRDRL